MKGGRAVFRPFPRSAFSFLTICFCETFVALSASEGFHCVLRNCSAPGAYAVSKLERGTDRVGLTFAAPFVADDVSFAAVASGKDQGLGVVDE